MPNPPGIDRTVLLPRVPKVGPTSPYARIEVQVGLLEQDIQELGRYLEGEQVALYAMYDEIVRPMNEFLTERVWNATTAAQITGDQNNYALGQGIVHRLSTNAARTITGIVAPVAGRLVVIINVGSNNLVLAHQSGSSDAANRILSHTGGNVTLAADKMALLWYDVATSRWRLIVAS